MIKINNKRTLLTLTIVASLVLLAQTVQAFSVIPMHLRCIPGSNCNVNTTSFFCWRYIQTHKVLTIEWGTPDIQINLRDRQYFRDSNTLTPDQFIREADFNDGNHFIQQAGFNLRKFNRTGTIYEVVTVEQLGYLFSNVRGFQVSPYSLAGINNFRSEGINQQTKFKWKDVNMTDGQIYRAVTLENQ